LRRYLRELGDEATVVICGASALLVVSHYQATTPYFREVFGNRFDATPAAGALPFFWWFGSSLVLYFFVPLALSFATRGSFTRSYGLAIGDFRAGALISALLLAVMLPAVYFASTMRTFAGQYPLAGQAAFTLTFPGPTNVISWKLFAAYELGYVLYFFAWEFLFRGWMLNGLLPKFGRAGAILIQTAPFAVMHLGKAEIEALGSIAAGVALGVMALRTRSFLYGWMVHSAVAVSMDVLASWKYLFPPHGSP
jgi:uncharacterized protein